MLSRDMRDVKKMTNQTYKMKNTMSKIKNTMSLIKKFIRGINYCKRKGKRTRSHSNRTIQNETRGEKILKKGTDH